MTPKATAVRLRELAQYLDAPNPSRLLASEVLQALGTQQDTPRHASLQSNMQRAERAKKNNDTKEALHYLGEVLYEIAWQIKDIGDPQADAVLDVARSFNRMHR